MSSRLAAALELFAEIDVQLARGRNLDVVVQAVRVPGPRIEAIVERTAHAALVAELADRVSEERHPLEGLFPLVAGSLRELAVEAPQLQHCASCERPLPEAPAGFSAAAGGFLCADCAPAGMHPVPVAALKVLRVMASGGSDLYRRLKLDELLMGEVERVLEAQLEYHLDRQLKSLRFLRQMRSYA